MANQILELYLNEFQSINKLSKQFQLSRYAVEKILKDNNVQLRTLAESTRCKTNTVISSTQHEILEGCLLSDAGMFKHQRRFTPDFRLSSIQEEFVKYLYNKLPFTTATIDYRAAKSIINKKDNSIVSHKEFWIYRTKSDIALIDYWDRWYPERKKIIPEDFNITPLSLLMCFIGDGYCYYANSRTKKRHLGLCLEGFDVKYTTVFNQKLKDLNLNFHLQTVKNNNYMLICRTQSEIEKFYNYIGNCPIELGCFSYKWKDR